MKTIGTPASHTHVNVVSAELYGWYIYHVYLIRSVLSWRTRDMQTGKTFSAGHNTKNIGIVCICRLKRMQPLPAVVVRFPVSFPLSFTRILPYVQCTWLRILEGFSRVLRS